MSNTKEQFHKALVADLNELPLKQIISLNNEGYVFPCDNGHISDAFKEK
jgi:hypothetical protein